MLFTWKYFHPPTPKGETHYFSLFNNNDKKIILFSWAAYCWSVLRAAVGCVLSTESERNSWEHFQCSGPSKQWSRKYHIWPLISWGEKLVPISGWAISHRGCSLGGPRNSAFCGRGGMALCCLYCHGSHLKPLFISEGARWLKVWKLNWFN